MSSGSWTAHTAAATAPAAAPPNMRLSGTAAQRNRTVQPGYPKPMEERDLTRYHERTRRKGVNRLIFWTARVFLGTAILVYFSLERMVRSNIPKKGPVILAANHRSFLDPFIIACCLRRPVYFV